MAPVRERGDDQSIDIRENCRHGFALQRWGRRQLGFKIPGLHLSQHREVFDVLKVVRDPVDDLMAEAAKFRGGHVAGWWSDFTRAFFWSGHTSGSHNCGSTLSSMRFP